ncbi:pyrimidine reductase, riboflavin biosynthesis [Synechococcus sp. PCC 7502]|uniref:RibD family protein n=1 Tax=Synechococcus sp. PCC 7502 TaxID=1173263 RepID=UPI00029FE2BF|nr:RibD family protein [Synechococcus sp. PCC 7502]AFY72886.1 pyrimidine reductase, riboflavin biosynthesis [Synechococcus sp. PCC 7502]
MPNLLDNYLSHAQLVPDQVYSFADLAFPTDGIKFEYQSQVYTRPYIIFNMVSSVDGKATTNHGELTGLGSRMDRKIMNRLRSQVDAVLVGGETLRVDPFIPTIPPELLDERWQNFSGQPLGIVISNSGNLPLDHRFWQAGKELRIVFLGVPASLEAEKLLAEKAQVFRLSDTGIAGMLDFLWQRFSVKRLMVEGGASVNYEFISHGWSDEIFLTLCPKLVGGIKNTSILGGNDYGLSDALGVLPDLELRSLYHHENELYLRYKIEFAQG